MFDEQAYYAGIDAYSASAKKSKTKKYVAHTANYGEAHMNPDYTISYGQNDFEIPDYLEFNVDGQYVRADVKDDSSRGLAQWFIEVPFADSTMWINCWSWGYKTLEYNIDYRGRAGVPDYEGKTTFDNLAPIQQAIDHIVNDVKLKTSVAPSDNVYGGTQVYVDGAFVPWEERFNDKTWSAKKSKTDTKMSFTDNVNKMRVNNYAKTGNINTVMKKRD